MKYKWQIKEDYNFSKDFLKTAYDSEIIAKLLLNRGIDTVEKAKYYLNPEEYIPSKPEEIGDLVKAKSRIISAIKKGEKITIFGDYDVDGTTATSCLLLALKQFTENIDFYIPNRLTEGYGLNPSAVKAIAKRNKEAYQGTPLLITCDCGITNVKETELANELGMDVIITDHHSLPEILPPAHAILNPKMLPEGHKLHFLPGVGVAYKLAEAILNELCNSEQSKESSNDLLDLVTLGMIADMAPLVDENRYLVQIGLSRLAHTKKLGLKELLRVCGFSQKSEAQGQKSKIDSDHIGFGIAPRINAVGRLTDGNMAVKLMTTNDLIEATYLATELDFQNKERQILCDETLKDVLEMIPENKDDKCIILAKEGWHHGIIGIVASRVVEKFSLPTLLICIDKEQNIARGSGRSACDLNIVDALVSCSSHLEKFGGHKAACGLSIKPESLEIFISDLKRTINKTLESVDIEPVLKIDSKINLLDLNLDLIEKINKLAPFGLGNKMPIFISDELEIAGTRQIGKEGKHLKLYLRTLDYEPRTFEALIWNHDFKIVLNEGDKLKIAFTPKLNSFNGETFIQLEVKDFDLAKENKFEKREDYILEIFDSRRSSPNVQEKGSVFFAESNQKDFLPLKTYSRNKIFKCNNLVLLDIPPDEDTMIEIIKKSSAEKLYLAFSNPPSFTPQHLLKRLIGMLRYAKNNMDSKINEIQLMSALGINRSSLAFALKTLEKVGFLTYIKNKDSFNIDILETYRQNFDELIEYNLLVSELKNIQDFQEWFFESEISEIELKVKKLIKSKMILLQEAVK